MTFLLLQIMVIKLPTAQRGELEEEIVVRQTNSMQGMEVLTFALAVFSFVIFFSNKFLYCAI